MFMFLFHFFDQRYRVSLKALIYQYRVCELASLLFKLYWVVKEHNYSLLLTLVQTR